MEYNIGLHGVLIRLIPDTYGLIITKTKNGTHHFPEIQLPKDVYEKLWEWIEERKMDDV